MGMMGNKYWSSMVVPIIDFKCQRWVVKEKVNAQLVSSKRFPKKMTEDGTISSKDPLRLALSLVSTFWLEI